MLLSEIIKKSNLNIELPGERTEEIERKFAVFFRLLIEENAKYNLTAITEEHDVYIKHFLDSLVALSYLKKNATVIDIGAGAGFPSLPLLIVRPDLRMTMLDSVGKKVNFIILALEKLELAAVVAQTRAEDFAKTHRETFDYAVSRAVAPLNTLLEYALPLIKVGGSFLAYKGTMVDDELKQAKNALKELGAAIPIPHNCNYLDFTRTLIEIKKTNQTPKKYPRPQGKPRTNPL